MFVGFLFVGCSYKTSIIVPEKDIDVKINCNNEEGVAGVVTAFIIDAATGYIVDKVDDSLDEYALTFIKQYQGTFKSDSICKKLFVTFQKNSTTSFSLPIDVKVFDNAPSLDIEILKKDIKSKNFKETFKLNDFPGSATFNLEWKTHWQKENQSFEKVVYNGKLFNFKFTKSGKIEFTKSDKLSILKPPKSNAGKTRHYLTITLTIINSDKSEIIKRLAKSFKDKKGEIQDAIVDAYKKELDE